MFLKKLLLIMWNEKFKSPLRIIEKSYARSHKHGYHGMIERLEREYLKIYPVGNRKVDSEYKYKKWIENNELDILETKDLEFNPFISIITPTYNTEKKYLIEMLDSVLCQTYKNFELCIADDASSSEDIISILRDYERKHSNISVKFRQVNGHISEASNSALELATGDYVAFLDHDDTLAPNALYEIVKKLNEDKALKLIYSDEDKIDELSNRYNPHFKSGWNPDMFYSQNYICHFVCIEKTIVDSVGGFRKGYEGSQDYDLLLRVTDVINNEEIDRIEKILYHWRAIKGSTAYGSAEKDYAHDAGLRALKDYFLQKDKSVSVEDGKLPNTYKVKYLLPEIPPLVSLLIPTRDGYEILYKCIESILKKTRYNNYEIIILNNETTCSKTLDYFEKIKKYKHISILEYHHPFNYSAINNFGVKYAKGEIIGLLNNDVEVISEGWLIEMVSHAQREDIGAVGAMLYYDNDTIQHAGVVLGIGGVAGHSHKYFDKKSYGYFSRLCITQNYSAVTGACLVVRKKLYEEVNGLNEKDLTVAFNDVDFCLKLLEKGHRNLWTPNAELYHHESISRGSEDSPEKIKRFNSEVEYMKKRWLSVLKEDKYYNKNLSLTHENFEVKIDE